VPEATMTHSIAGVSLGPARDGDAALKVERMPKLLQSRLAPLYTPTGTTQEACLGPDQIYHGDARIALGCVEANSVALSFWSPPYFVGKSYEKHLTFDAWQQLLKTVVALHFRIIRPGCFLVINIADILCFRDETMPRVQAEALTMRKSPVTRAQVLAAMQRFPQHNRRQLAAVLGCSEQTVDRRLNGNNIRGGKYESQTRVKIVGGLVEEWALEAGFYTYDRRIWVKDPAWENSRWASLSYRSVDNFEYLYFFWKPGVTRFNRARLTPKEWAEWGSLGVWAIPSVRANEEHEAMFPLELARRVIRLLTDPGDLVLDCFVGSGSTAIAAMQEGRHFIGIDAEAKYVRLARKQIAAEGQRLC